MSGVIAKNGGELIGINPNLGNRATDSDSCFDTKVQCYDYKGCDKSNGQCEPSKAAVCQISVVVMLSSVLQGRDAFFGLKRC